MGAPTRLAVEYAWQHEADYSALLLVVGDSPENLCRNLAALVGRLGALLQRWPRGNSLQQ